MHWLDRPIHQVALTHHHPPIHHSFLHSVVSEHHLHASCPQIPMCRLICTGKAKALRWLNGSSPPSTPARRVRGLCGRTVASGDGGPPPSVTFFLSCFLSCCYATAVDDWMLTKQKSTMDVARSSISRPGMIWRMLHLETRTLSAPSALFGTCAIKCRSPVPDRLVSERVPGWACTHACFRCSGPHVGRCPLPKDATTSRRRRFPKALRRRLLALFRRLEKGVSLTFR